MNLIDDAVNGKISEELNAQYQQYIKLISNEQTVDTQSLVTKLKDLIDIKEIEIANNNLIENFDLIQKLNRKNFEVLKEIKKVAVLKVIELLNNKKTELVNSKKEIEKSMQPDEREEINKKIESLNIKKIVSNNFDNIKENIGICKNNKKIDEVLKKLSTKSLTMKSREIAKYLITDTYVKNFNEELQLLKLKDLNIVVEEGKAKKGKNQYKITLKGKNASFIPSDILSEGENRAVSLAAFFAESKGRSDRCPLIVDDPISSLDYNYERSIAERLVNVAKDRQVIIFTHRLSLVANINEFAERENVKHITKHICTSKYKKGIIDDEVDLITCGRIDKALNRLKDKFNQIKNLEQNDEDYKIKKSEICQKFRNCVEKMKTQAISMQSAYITRKNSNSNPNFGNGCRIGKCRCRG